MVKWIDQKGQETKLLEWKLHFVFTILVSLLTPHYVMYVTDSRTVVR